MLKCRGVWRRTFAVLRPTARPHWVATNGHQGKVDPAQAAWRWEQRCNYTLPLCSTVLCMGRRLNTTLKKLFMNHWLATVISSDKMIFQVPTPHHSPLDQMLGNRESCSSQNQSGERLGGTQSVKGRKTGLLSAGWNNSEGQFSC